MKTKLFIAALVSMNCFLVYAKPPKAVPVPKFDHVVVVIFENRGYRSIIGNSEAPYINSLLGESASFTQSFALWHVSQPNYLALFSGSLQGVTDNEPHFFNAPTVAGQLRARGKEFIGYAETDAPHKHKPWESFAESVGAGMNFSAFPSDFSKLPALSFVIPNDDDNMHSDTISRGDAWLSDHMDSYIDWAETHNSLFILTWDEDEDDEGSLNQIATLIAGADVIPGAYDESISHFTILRTIQEALGLPGLAFSNQAQIIRDIWQPANAPKPPKKHMKPKGRIR